MKPLCWSWCIFHVLADHNVYLSLDGDDAGLGTLESPFRTIQHTQQYVRSLGTASGPITVHFRQGLYRLTSTWQLNEEDSGTPDAPITYKAYCNATLTQQLQKITDYPYVAGSSLPLRYLWNGVGEKADWVGPDLPITPLAYAGEEYCFDRVNQGRVCYREERAHCVQQCNVSCQANVDKKVYSDLLYNHFEYLFGKDLRKEDTCMEYCTASCEGCEDVTLTGFAELKDLNWTLDHVAASGLEVYRTPLDMDVDALYVNGKQMFPASYPNAQEQNPMPWSEAFASVAQDNTGTGFIIRYNRSTFSTLVANWDQVEQAQVHIYPSPEQMPFKLVYHIASIDTVQDAIHLRGGGSSLLVVHGPGTTLHTRFRVENVQQEFYDPVTQSLYVIPPTDIDLATARFEVPTLDQIVRISGKRDNHYVRPGVGIALLEESTDTPRASYIHIEGFKITGSKSAHFDIYEHPGGSDLTLTRSGALFLESVEHVRIRHNTLLNLQGNGIFVSGTSISSEITNNHIYAIGQSALTIMPKQAFRVNAYRRPVLSHLLLAKANNISYNRMHHYGHRLPQATGLRLKGSANWVFENIHHNVPLTGFTTKLEQAGALEKNIVFTSWLDGRTATVQLIMPIQPLEIPPFHDVEPSTLQTIVIDVPDIDTSILVKIVGAEDRSPGSGRVDESQGLYHTGCSGCLVRTAAQAKIRLVQDALEDWNDRQELFVQLDPMHHSFELQMRSASVMDAWTSVDLAFHRVLPNGIVDLYGTIWQSRWRVHTRHCREVTNVYAVACGGPCGCGTNAEEMETQQPVCTLVEDVLDVQSTVCTGPFEGWSDCRQSGVFQTLLYYNCTSTCTTTTCT